MAKRIGVKRGTSTVPISTPTANRVTTPTNSPVFVNRNPSVVAPG